ncbi:uncharacterized protein LOC131994760 [Stomoxys calcitrans]|uniref:uncharacterized protein LOC131994760 n=1 Tax=Stomoxys calcitrans TaxID=35570 RepID=UPI0027E37046|nr:uncharacterized protein LOC131994760 [Stomoxys calcitrans]
MNNDITTGQPQNDNGCILCPNPPDSNMLSCMECKRVFHKICLKNANRTNQLCPDCADRRPPSPTHSIRSHSSAVSRQSHARSIQLQLQRLEEERNLNLEFLNKKYDLLQEAATVNENSSTSSQSVQNWVNQLPNHDQQAESALMSTNNNGVHAQSTHLFEETSYLDMPNSSAERNSNSETTRGTGQNKVTTGSATQLPPNSTNLCSAACNIATSTIGNTAPIAAVSATTNSGDQRYLHTQTASLNPNAVTFINLPKNSYFNTATQLPPSVASAPRQNYPENTQSFIYQAPISSTMRPQTNSFNSTSQFHNSNLLQQSSINARQSVPKELPIFSGHAEDWPLFISTFEWSTSTCCFSEAENLIRLQKSLKGEALYSVQHLLIHPSNVSAVIDILRMLYGQPEKILNSIKERINSSPKVDENNLQTLTHFAINVRSLIATIKAGNLPDEINNSFLLQQLLQKLPSSYQMQWATIKQQLMIQNKKPNLSAFDSWLFSVGLTASTITTDPISNNRDKNRHTKSSSFNNNKTTTSKRAFIYSHSDDKKCIVCNNKNCRAVSDCPTYQSLERSEKWNVVRTKKLCKYCLGVHMGECRKKKKCGEEGCEYYHHSSLHRYTSPSPPVGSKQTSNQNMTNSSNERDVIHNSHNNMLTNILFKIVPITIYGNNKSIETYAFIDEGSSVSLMDNSIASDLKIDGVASPLCLKWTGGNSKTRVSLNVCTVESLSLPVQSLNYKLLAQRYRHLRNLPVKSYVNAEPKLLIGLNHLNLGISNKIREGASNEPVAVRTKLGWLIYGTTSEPDHTSKPFNFQVCNCTASDEKLDELVRSFYTLESIGICTKDPLKSEDESRALNLLSKYMKQKASGNYEVPLLWKFDCVELPNSFDMAIKRLTCLEGKLKRNFDLLNIFRDTISKYLSKGYIRRLDEKDIRRNDGKVWYLPIFAVFNKNKPGKSRVVWDAAARVGEFSLNSFLLKGPDMLTSLPSILFKFRQKKVAVCGDIEEMFHQIHIRAEDRDVQRFLWRDCNQERAPDVYIMDVMIFGATCAPSISQYVKNYNADKFLEEFPLAAKAIKQNHYVDDLLCSIDTAEEAIKLVKDVCFVHRQAGFNIRNWVSNSREVRNAFASTLSEKVKCINFKAENSVEKVLGVFWEHDEDVITFKIASWLLEGELLSTKKAPTKREMLRLVMSIYDPLGLIGHIVMFVKVLMQEVWRSKSGWDEPIHHELAAKWSHWLRILPDIENLKIERCYLKTFHNYEGVNVQLHTFVDASKDGYAAVCYLRLKKNADVVCSLVTAKTRVAPIKITSVPRLELMAALIGARLAKFVLDNHEIGISKKYFWSDSKTVLSWINSDHRKYNQFVAFRVTEILELSSISDWNWVPSRENVADDATKWSKIPNFSDSSRWFHGPAFLFQPEEMWPQKTGFSGNTEEERIHTSYPINKYEPILNELRFSKWNRLVRAIAYVVKFITICRKNEPRCQGLTLDYLKRAEHIIYKQVQSVTYSAEIAALNTKSPVPKSSEIFSKTPYLEEGLLRVDGRIDLANVTFDQKRPIILPRKHYVTKLIILHYHEKFHHMHHETVVNELRQKYAISKLRTTVKTIFRSCQFCKITKVVSNPPQMAKLPRARVAAYASPFFILE